MEFPEAWGGVSKNPFCGGGKDITTQFTKLTSERNIDI